MIDFWESKFSHSSSMSFRVRERVCTTIPECFALDLAIESVILHPFFGILSPDFDTKGTYTPSDPVTF